MSSTDDDASGITAKLASTSIGDRGDGTKAGTNGGANVNGIAHAHSNDHANSNELSFAKGGQNGSGAQATQPPTPPAVADVVSDKYYKAFLIKLFEFGRAAESVRCGHSCLLGRVIRRIVLTAGGRRRGQVGGSQVAGPNCDLAIFARSGAEEANGGAYGAKWAGGEPTRALSLESS